VRPAFVVVNAPLLDGDLGFAQGVVDLAIQAFVAELAVEAFAVAILPGTTGFDLQWCSTHSFEPCPQRAGNKFRSVVRTQVFSDA
jgi:hypothetical protein